MPVMNYGGGAPGRGRLGKSFEQMFQEAYGVGAGLGQMVQERKRMGQLATSYRRTLGVLYPDRKSEFETMGMEDLEGELQGHSLKTALQQAQQRAAQQGVEMDYKRALAAESGGRVEEQGRQRAIEEAMTGFSRTVAEGLTQGGMGGEDVGVPMESGDGIGMGEPGAWTGASVRRAVGEGMRRYPQALASPRAHSVMSGLGSLVGMDGDVNVKPELNVLTGEGGLRVPTVHMPGGKGFQVVPEQGVQPQLEPLYDEQNGDLMGYQYWNGRAWVFKGAKPKPTGQMLPVLDPETKQALPGWGMDSAGRVREFQGDVERGMAQMKKNAAEEAARPKKRWPWSAATAPIPSPIPSGGTRATNVDVRQTQTLPSKIEMVRQAREAIRTGKDPVAVRAKLRQLGYEVSEQELRSGMLEQ